MADSVTVSALSSTLTQTFQLEFDGNDSSFSGYLMQTLRLHITGLAEVELMLKRKGGIKKPLTKYWTASLKLLPKVVLNMDILKVVITSRGTCKVEARRIPSGCRLEVRI